MALHDDETVDDMLAEFVEDSIEAEHGSVSGIEFAASTHRGKVRANNEDQYLVVRRTRSESVLATSLANASELTGEEQDAWLLAVADGLGGHASGEIASSAAIQTILSFSNALSSWIMLPSDALPTDDISRRVGLYVEAIQQELRSQAESNPELAGMATTLTGAYVFGSTAFVINIGDSRSYLVHSNKIRQITHDHTVGQDMQDDGVMVELASRFCNVLTRTLSTDDNKGVDVDLFQVELRPGDNLLLCSDGLTDMVTDEAIEEIVSAETSTKAACERLVNAALAQGGRDNVTVVLARMS